MTDQPSHDPRAEQSILGAILHNPAVFADLGRLNTSHFFSPQNALLFKTLQDMHTAGEDIDSVTVFDKMRQRGELRKIGAPYLSDLLQAFKSTENVGTYAQIVIDRWKIRTINQLGDRFKQIHDTADEIPQALEAARRFLDEVDLGTEREDDFDSAYQSWMDWYEADTVTIPTPWAGLNQVIQGGFHRGRLYTLAGRPGAGKSAMCLNALTAAARGGHRSVAYSLEMPREECMSRILAAGANVPLKNLFQHRLSTAETARIEEFAAQPWLRSLTIDDSPTQTIESVAADARARKKRGGLDVVAVDHSLLLDPVDKNKTEIQHIAHVARSAKLLARRLDCVVVLLHQLNRDNEKNERRRPRMSDLHGGGERDADVIVILDRDREQIIGNIVKNRMGATNQAAVMVDELAYGRLG